MIKDLFKAENLMFLMQGLAVTLTIAVATILLSIMIGTILGIARHSRNKALSRMSGVYIESVRNVPMLLFILAVRFMTPLNAVVSGIVAMTIFTSAVIAEIVRAGLNSIGQGQWEAAKSQGLNHVTTLVHIVLPQALRNITPALVSQFITVVKDTSFVWAVGTEELTGRAIILMGKHNNPVQVFTLFGLVAAIYFIPNYVLSHMAHWRQRKILH
ncbi:MAG: amino acid ABC transporter permease [Clostridia bacterium]|nr:amino acid ABC transporter permease [Clostridia bacterium]